MTDKAEVSISREGETVTVAGAGELDLTIAAEFEQALESAQASSNEVVLDLRSAHYIDSAVLQAIFAMAKKMRDTDRPFKTLLRADSHPLYVLNTTGCSAFMDIHVE